MSKPKTINLIRHGESSGNKDKSIYSQIPDYAVPLTQVGLIQAFGAGKRLRETFLGRFFFYVSPFRRTRETFQEIAKSFKREDFEYREDPRIHEQMWSGKIPKDGFDFYQERERNDYSSYWFRFEGGENGQDAFNRVSSFLDTMWRDFEKENFPENCAIITHGYLLRIFLMRFFHWTVEEFELLKNPRNASITTLYLNESTGKYELKQPFLKHPAHTHPHQYPIKLD